ncbi:hypothetical protein SMQE13_17660 [Serratia marcescens]|nr:hypothetical protein SMQE13_17660 [Serratia marcescens]
MTNARLLRRWKWKLNIRRFLPKVFKLAQISEGAVLLTYKSFQRNAQGHAVRCTARSSIWMLTEKAGWQMWFHQGTPIED